jgi:hypothetical protein
VYLIWYIMRRLINLKPNCQLHCIVCSQVHLWVSSQVQSWTSSQGHTNCTRWYPFSVLDCILPIALDGILSASVTVHSELCSIALSQSALLYTSKEALKILSSIPPSMLSRTLPVAPNGTLAAHLALGSQVHSIAGRYIQYHLTIYCHIRYSLLNPETCHISKN